MSIPSRPPIFEMLIDVMPVHGRERIAMARVDICEVEDFPYLKPRQRVIGRAENERHLLRWNLDPFEVISDFICLAPRSRATVVVPG